MKKGTTVGYIFTFLLGVGITALVAYIYVAVISIPKEAPHDIPEAPADSTDAGEEEKPIRRQPESRVREKPGDRSYLPRECPGSRERTPAVSLPGNNYKDNAKPSGTEGVESADGGTQPMRPATDSGFSLFLRQDEVNGLLRRHLNESGENGLLPPGAVRNAKLDIRGRELGLVALLNLDEIARVTGSEEDRQKLETVKKFLPFVDTRNLAVEIHGNFSVRNGMLKVDPEAQLKIASMNMKLKTLHGLLLSGESLPVEVPLQPIQGIQIDDLTVENNGIQVRGKQVRVE